MRILVTGGTGFVGRRVVHALRAQGDDVRALVRDPRRAQTLEAWGCELAPGDTTDAASLRAAVAACDAVVHLVGIIVGRTRDFGQVMEQGTSDLVAAAGEAGARRFVLMSALGTSEESKDLVPYYHAKWQMEKTLESSGLDYTIFRPSFVFGADGGALPTFVRQVRWSPVVPVAGDGTARLQPIWVDDVAAHFARAVGLDASVGGIFCLGGPDVVTWNELYRRLRAILGVRRATLHVPMGLMKLAAGVVEQTPVGKPPVTRDQLKMLAAGDNVCDMTTTIETFGIPLLPLDEQLRRAV